MSKRKVIKAIIFFLCLGGLLYSMHNLVTFFINNHRNVNLQADLRERVINTPAPTNENAMPNEADDFVVDFDSLMQINPDSVGWIKFNNNQVNYPIVQAADNDFYLHRDIHGNANDLGTIFMDFRNNRDFTSQNTIIYGHDTPNSTMFGSLGDALAADFFDDEANNQITIITPEAVLEWQIFSVYTYIVEDSFSTPSFSEDEFLAFINVIKQRSVHEFDLDVGTSDRLLTLITCYGTGNTIWRTVIHAKLVSE